MPRWLQVVLAIIAVGIVTVIILAFVGYRWMSRNGGRLQAQMKQLTAQGSEYGRGKDVTDCMDESVRLYRASGKSFKGRFTTQIWMESCVRSATVTPAFCATAPRGSEIFKSAQWAVAECAKRGLANDRGCSNFMLVAPRACDMKRE
ncbi:MAG TPA: hypothetical protein VGR02_22015 [Thermoanaerobaculia bacterium]|jgi:hypothetical protein|nr:hypothetical protein [Thermoanaerobaculia bacterium]